MSLGRKALAVHLAEKLSTPEVKVAVCHAQRLVDELIECVLTDAREGKKVHVQNFGTFSYVNKRARIGRNPRTKEEKIIAARRVLSFLPAKTLREQMEQEIAKTKTAAEQPPNEASQ